MWLVEKINYLYPVSFNYAGTNFMESLISLHHDMMFFLIVIFILVFWLLVVTVWKFKLKSINAESPLIVRQFFLRSLIRRSSISEQSFGKSYSLEFIWTVGPGLIVVFLILPSFALLYASEEEITPLVTVKVYGRQWFWSYEYNFKLDSNLDSLFFESHIVSNEKLKTTGFRLLEVYDPLVIPINTPVRLLITSFDVIHSWGVPSFGLKIDAIPGSINQGILSIKNEGIFYGQCYELCGNFHGFMPICVYAVSFEKFIFWYCLMLDVYKK